MKKGWKVGLMLLLLLGMTASFVQAQEEDQRRGTIQGVVYEDVNGDGLCVNTGVEGENPVEGVDIVFTNSAGDEVFTLFSGHNGIYGAFAMGYSFWTLTATPPADWIVTSANDVVVPIFEDSLVATDVNFCVQRVANVNVFQGTGGIVYLPESGAGQQNGAVATAVAALFGFGFIGGGVLLEWRRRAA